VVDGYGAELDGVGVEELVVVRVDFDVVGAGLVVEAGLDAAGGVLVDEEFAEVEAALDEVGMGVEKLLEKAVWHELVLVVVV